MKFLWRSIVLFSAVALGIAFAVWLDPTSMGLSGPRIDREAPLPTQGLDGRGLGYCVTLHEGLKDIGQVLVPFHRADPSKRDEFAISVYNAVTLIAQNAGRPDLAAKASRLRIVAPGTAPDPEVMTCFCTNTIWSGDPRQGGKVKGCGGACGSCTYCSVVEPQIK